MLFPTQGSCDVPCKVAKKANDCVCCWPGQALQKGFLTAAAACFNREGDRCQSNPMSLRTGKVKVLTVKTSRTLAARVANPRPESSFDLGSLQNFQLVTLQLESCNALHQPVIFQKQQSW